jgi:tetratricopeptide (TPR) repeat protein
LAGLAFAQGKWHELDQLLLQLAEREMEWSLEVRALFSIFLAGFSRSSIPGIDLRQLRDAIGAWDPGEAVALPSYRNLFGPHAQHHPEFRRYLLGLLSAGLGEIEDAGTYSMDLRGYGRAPKTIALTLALSQSVDAHLAHSQGDLARALTALEAIGYFPPFEFISVSPFYSRALDRWLRGEILRETDRPEEALDWYATLSDGWGEFLFAAPAHLRQAEIHDRLGNRDDAIFHYGKFMELWKDADPVFEPMLDAARQALEALEVVGGPA